MGEPGGERRRAGGAAGKAEEKSGETEVGNRKAGLGNGRVGTRPNRGEGLAGGPEPNSTAGPPLPSSSPAHPWPRRCRRRLVLRRAEGPGLPRTACTAPGRACAGAPPDPRRPEPQRG